MDTDWNCKKSGVHALRGGWTITGIAKKVQNQEGVCISRGWVDGWMNGVLGHFYALSRLNWAGDNLG